MIEIERINGATRERWIVNVRGGWDGIQLRLEKYAEEVKNPKPNGGWLLRRIFDVNMGSGMLPNMRIAISEVPLPADVRREIYERAQRSFRFYPYSLAPDSMREARGQ